MLLLHPELSRGHNTKSLRLTTSLRDVGRAGRLDLPAFERCREPVRCLLLSVSAANWLIHAGSPDKSRLRSLFAPVLAVSVMQMDS
jgi:hypothetical protein